MDLFNIRSGYIAEGYDFLNASSKTCQDVILSKLAKCPLSENVTIKGGVVIQHISKDKRRATRDFDFDFIRYSLDEESILDFINTLNKVSDGVVINIIAPVEELGHEDYNGKRVFIELIDDSDNKIETKLDIGVHNRLNVGQDVCFFEISSLGESVSLLGNSQEQMFAEKLKSLLKIGRFSTRYKDVFDFYYFINSGSIGKERLLECFDEFIFGAEDMRENNVADIHRRLSSIFRDEEYLERAGAAHNNWLEVPIKTVADGLLSFFKKELS